MCFHSNRLLLFTPFVLISFSSQFMIYPISIGNDSISTHDNPMLKPRAGSKYPFTTKQAQFSNASNSF